MYDELLKKKINKEELEQLNNSTDPYFDGWGKRRRATYTNHQLRRFLAQNVSVDRFPSFEVSYHI